MQGIKVNILMVAYTYIIVRQNKEPGPRFYFGYKTIKQDKGFYYGSSKLLRADIKKYGVDYFKKTIVKYYNSISEVLNAETKYLIKVNAAQNPLFYNQTNGNLLFSTAGKRRSIEEFRKLYSKNFLKGNQRTENQKKGDAEKYKTRSNKRLLADIIHSIRMQILASQGKLQYLYKNRGTMSIEMRKKLSFERTGITKETNVGRMNTSLKLQGNQNNQQSYIKHAKMTDEAFATYLRTKSQHPNVQQMLKTRRQIGKLFLETGRWMPKEFATSI